VNLEEGFSKPQALRLSEELLKASHLIDCA